MKQKTLEKIIRKFEILPLHHIDTNIFIEADKETKLGDACASYLNRIGYKYRGIISLSVLGELFSYNVERYRKARRQRTRYQDF
jgi:hypothetical protein